MSEEEPYVSNIDVGYVKGKINQVQVHVRTEFADAEHTLRYTCQKSAGGDELIQRTYHKHPWGDTLPAEPEEYSSDALTARSTASCALVEHNLNDATEWRTSP